MASMQSIPDSERDRIFNRLKNVQNNNICIECDKKNTKWASIHLSIFLCYDCSGKHRQFGPKLSLVKSMTFDSWAPKYISFMEHGGNQKFIEFMKKHGVNHKSLDWENNQVVKKYKQELAKIIDNLENKSQQKAQNNQVEQLAQQTAQINIAEQEQLEQEKKRQQEEKMKQEALKSQPQKVVTSNVVFATKKTNAGVPKNKLKAEKIDDFDWDSLAFDDGSEAKKETKQDYTLYENQDEKEKNSKNNNSNDDFFSDFDNNNKNTRSNNGFVKEDKQFNSSSNNGSGANNAKFDKYKSTNAKAISSASLFNQDEPSNQDKQQYASLAGSKAISSDAFFGRKESEEEDYSNNQQVENIKTFFWNVKEKAQNYVEKAKENWK